ITNIDTQDQTTAFANGDYDGLGFLVEDDTGNNTLVVMMTSTRSIAPSIAIYNEFINN
ncbi:MAG: hypothetical protein IMF17_04030, partial [Proteobacteria bacterium]|nr:hypothetical protein [Pseudomonadota bacterium]